MRNRCRFLFAVTAVLAVGGSAFAADMPVKAPAPVAPPKVTLFIEGGAFWNAGPAPSFLGLIQAPGSAVGGQGAAGFDVRFSEWSDWHFSAQFRYARLDGTTNGGPNMAFDGPNVPAILCSPAATVCGVALSNANMDFKSAKLVVDAAFGRDVSFLPGAAQAKFGIRFANIRDKMEVDFQGNEFAIANGGPLQIQGSVSPGSSSAQITCTGTCNSLLLSLPGGSIQQTSRFIGVGPRIGAEGEVPMGAWSLDYMVGAAVLFGHKTLQVSSPSLGSFGTPFDPVFHSEVRDWAAVFNTDASLGISFAIAPNTKFTVGYRVDAYFAALKNPSGTNIENIDYIDHGPFGRITAKF